MGSKGEGRDGYKGKETFWWSTYSVLLLDISDGSMSLRVNSTRLSEVSRVDDNVCTCW